MSKVKIQGSASGSAVYTLTTGSTSTDRTITLPDATGTLLNSDGDGSSLTGISAGADTSLSNLSSTGESKVCQAWVNFDGTGTPSIRDQHNVSTITDNGTGNYTINFTNNLANANYSVSGTVSANSGNGAAHGLETTKTSHSTSGIGVLTWYTDHTLFDEEYVNVLVFGD